jgi:alkaline phosphatase
MICAEQIKAARALLGWSASELATRSTVGATTIRRYEMLGGIPQGNVKQGEVELAFHSEDHTGILVPIFAYGAQSQQFQGVYENTEVFGKILRLMGMDKP